MRRTEIKIHVAFAIWITACEMTAPSYSLGYQQMYSTMSIAGINLTHSEETQKKRGRSTVALF